MRLAMMRAVLAVSVVVGCVFAAGLVQAYEARVFEGAFVDATVEDLYPRTAESGKMYYSEEYAFVLTLSDKVKMQVKFGMSNLLGDNGTGFVDAGMSFKGVGKARLRQKVAKKQWSFEKSPFSLDFDSLVFSGDAALMKVEMKRGKMHGLLEMQAVVPGFRPGSGRVEVPGEGFIECVVWPSLSVKGKIWNAETGASKEFTGNAVLTHSVTTLPPQFQPPRWFYFKGDDPDRPILLQGVQLGEEFGGKAYGWAVVVEGGSTVARVKGFAVTPVDLRPKDDATIPWGLYLEDKASGFEGAVKGTKLKKVADPLKRLPPVEAALVAKFIRPRNYFFDGEIELKVDGKTYKAKGLYRIDTLR